MTPLDLPEPDRRLFLEALVSYADACTLPSLTPSCPFYRVTQDGPTCGEECRGLAEREGVAVRPLHTSRIEGLLLKGRALPLASAGGVEVFDAGKTYLSEVSLQIGSRSTTSLLLGLASALRPPVLPDSEASTADTFEHFAELGRRGVPVEAVIRSSIVTEMAEIISYRVALPHMIEVNAFPKYASSDLLSRASSAKDPWRDLLTALADSFDSEVELDNFLVRDYRQKAHKPRDGRHLMPQLAEPTPVPDGALSNRRLLLALSNEFRERVEEWLTRLLEEDLAGFIEATPPPPSVFMALRPTRARLDEIGQWLWERFTVADISGWSTSTLLLEWRAGRGEEIGGCTRRLLAERRVDHAKVADLALERSARVRGRRSPTRGLSPDDFVASAVAKLEINQPSEAAEIFHALLELRPTDGDAWNNYGFCLIPTSPRQALSALQTASLYELREPWINLANRALAFHILGETESALEVISEIELPDGYEQHEVYSWTHDRLDGGVELSVRTLPNYVKHLRAHLQVCTKV